MAITAKKGAAGGKPKNSLKRKAETQVEKKPVAGMKRKRTEYVVSEKKTEDKRKRHKEMVSQSIPSIAGFRFDIH